MNTWSFYKNDSGEFCGWCFTGSQKHLSANTPEGFTAVLGRYSPLQHRFNLETNDIDPCIPPPPENSELAIHEWDENKWAWFAKPTRLAVENKVRATRDGLLSACDWTQLPDADITEEQLTAWRAYRQALREVTDQSGFPHEIEWPILPSS